MKLSKKSLTGILKFFLFQTSIYVYLERLEGKTRKCLIFYVKIFQNNSVSHLKQVLVDYLDLVYSKCKSKFLTANELFSKCASFSLYWTQLFLLPLQSCTESYCWLTEASCIICLDKNQQSNTRLDFAKDKCIDHSFFSYF